VLALRAGGLDVHTVSVRRQDPSQLLSELDREEDRRTASLRPIGPLRLARHHIRALLASPGGYARTLAETLRGSPGGARRTLWQLFYFAQAIVLWAECRRRGLRHVHVHFANVAADVALAAVRFGNAAEGGWSWSLTMHGPTEFADVSAYRLAEKAADAAFVVCISDFARSQLMALLPEDRWDRLEVVHCGVDPSEFRPPSHRGERAPGAPLRVLCVGRLVPEKGEAVLVDALARLRDSGRAVECTFVGDGPSRDALKARVRALGLEDRVRFTGAVGQPEIRALYAQADAFCLPSFAEGVPVVLMEAMAMELPVVTTRITGVPELITDGEDGLLVAPGRADALAEALARLDDDPELCARLGAAGRRTVSEAFNLQRIGPELAALYARRLG
jgi:glycosyltransferase involved in cell wall biosynthesis